MNKMILKIILSYSSRSHYRNMLFKVLNISSPNRHASYALGLPVAYFISGNYNFQHVSSIFNHILFQFHLKATCASIPSEVNDLCHLILSESVRNGENERTKEIEKIMTYLLSKGYSSKTIKEKFFIYLKSEDCSYTKVRILANIDNDILLLLPLLSLPVSLLKVIASRAMTDRFYIKDFSNRISYLSYHLELEPSQLISALAKHASLLTMKFQRLDRKINVLKDANISPKYIVKDLWIFNYNEDLLASRIQAALKAGVQLKPWMLRCSENFFDSKLLKYSETQRILDGMDLHCFLAKKLNCSTEYVNYMMERNKLLKSINIPKIEKILNFLFGKGYTPEEIRLFPKVFCASVNTLEKRFEEFQHMRSTLPSLVQLCMSQKAAGERLKKHLEQKEERKGGDIVFAELLP